jgi:hypothetical protein
MRLVRPQKQEKEYRLSDTSGLPSNPANRDIFSSSGVSEHQGIFFLDFFAIFFSKNLKNYDLTRTKVSKD